MPKRTKENTLKARWSKKENDVLFFYPSKPDGHYLYAALSCDRFDYDGRSQPSILKELEARGYDLTTLQFSICKKDEAKKEPPLDTNRTNQ